MAIQDIIELHLKSVNEKWFENKAYEFRNSVFYEKTEDLLLYNDTIVNSITEEELDKDGNITDVKYNYFEKVIAINYDLTDFCISSDEYYYQCDLLSGYAPFEYSGINFRNQPPRIQDLSNITNKIILELYNYSSGLAIDNTESYVEEAKSTIEIAFNLLTENKELTFGHLLYEFKNLLLEKLDLKFQRSLYLNKFAPNNNPLHFNLDLERVSALLFLLFESKFLNDKNILLEFASKNFTCRDSNGNKTALILSNLKDRFGKQKQKNHPSTGISEIVNKFDESYQIAMSIKDSQTP